MATCSPAAWTRKGVMAELTGRRGGYSKGKGGSMHMFSREKNFYGGHGIVGAPGAARRRPRLCQPLSRQRSTSALTYFGDGAAQPGPGLRELQHGRAVEAARVFVIENNRYAMGTAVTRSYGPSRPLQARPVLRHSRRAGRRHGRARREGGRRQGACSMVPRRQWTVHPRDADLPLSRPLDVRPGQIPLQGGGPEDARASTIRSSR